MNNVSLRHLGCATLAVVAKHATTWTLTDQRRLDDVSGGPLMQTLCAEPWSELCGTNVSAAFGVETELREKYEVEILRRAGKACGGVFWAGSGSDAMELALRFVAELDAPTTCVVRLGGYHGNTLLARWLSTRRGTFGERQLGAWSRQVLDAPRLSENLDELVALRQRLPGKIVTVVEIVPTTAESYWGGRAEVSEFLQGCHALEIDVVVDEVVSGAYRNGWFSCFDWGPAAPSAVVVSKSLTCGAYPLSAVLLRQDRASALRAKGRRLSGFTCGLSDAAASIGLRCLNAYEKLTASGAFDARKRLVEKLAEELRLAHGLRVERSPCSLRMSTLDGAFAASIRAQFVREGLQVYEGEVRRQRDVAPMFIFAPALDLSQSAAAVLSERFVSAVRRVS